MEGASREGHDREQSYLHACHLSGPLLGQEEGVHHQEAHRPGILDIIRNLPVSTGLAIRRDIRGVEDFSSLISGVDHEEWICGPHYSGYPGWIQVPVEEHDCNGCSGSRYSTEQVRFQGG